MNKRLVVLIGLGVISVVGAVQLIEFKKHGPAGQSATGNQNSLDLKQTNSDSLPPGTPFVPEGAVTRQLDELQRFTLTCGREGRFSYCYACFHEPVPSTSFRKLL